MEQKVDVKDKYREDRSEEEIKKKKDNLNNKKKRKKQPSEDISFDDEKPNNHTARNVRKIIWGNGYKKCPCNMSIIIGIIIAVVVILVGIGIAIYFLLRPQPYNPNQGSDSSTPDTKETKTFEIIDDRDDDQDPKIKKEFEILTKPGDLKHINVIQKSKEETKMNDVTITNDIIRKTNYDIYFISEEKADEDNKLFYSKMYQGVVSIRSECTTEEDDCEPQPLVDLTKENSNLRNLQDTEIFKDAPIALCLFNITDNHVITTMTCPESLSDVKRNEIILDLYFFRPPAAERADKKNDNITLTKTRETDTNITHIHETNGGLCNIYNNWGSLCTTDMNTTLDAKGNLISYDEEAITIIDYDEKNSYMKNKVTNLIDQSKDLKESDIKNYEKALDSLLPQMKPYMKEEIQFTQSDYNDLYNVINDKKKSPEMQSYSPKKVKNTFRNLALKKITYIKETELFYNKITPVQVNLNLKIDPGINSPVMGAYGSVLFDEQDLGFSSIEENSPINDLIDKLSSLSKAGNYLAGELYYKIYDKLEGIGNEIEIQIRTLDELVKYYELEQVFGETLENYSYKKLPNDIVRISNELVSKLSAILNNIKSGNIKTNAEIFENDIYSYINEIHEIINEMLDNLATLSNTLLTKNNTFTIITNYYLNNTSSSYVNIIQKMKYILDTYFINAYNTIYPKIIELTELLEENSNDTLKSEIHSLQSLYDNLRDEIYTINSITEIDFEKVLSNLEKGMKYPYDIITKIKEYIIEIMNIKNNGYFTSDEDINNFNNSFASIIAEAEKVAKILDNVDIIDKIFDEIMIKFRESYISTIKYMEEIKASNFTLEDDVLGKSLFTKNVKSKMEADIKSLSDEILKIIKIENDVYIGKIKRYFDKFLEDNLDDLNNIIIDLCIIFSEEIIKSISDSFEMSLNMSLAQFTNITKNNILLAEQYIDQYHKMINDDAALKQLLENYYLDYMVIYKPYYDSSRTYQLPYFDVINGKMRTAAYSFKYNTFMANLNYSEEYLSNQLHFEIINEYREIFTKIKEEFQSILNNKLSEKFPDFYEVNFFENHIKIISKLNTRLDKYFSTEIFDQKYLKIINESINANIALIKAAKNNINTKHTEINGFPYFNDNTNDMCIAFRRKVCYGCTNCVSYTFFYDRFCFILKPYDLNYLDLKKSSYESVNNFGEFSYVFNNLNNKLIEKINGYNFIIGNLNLNISLFKQETLNENITSGYLLPLKEWVDLTLKEKFENVLLSASYNYYQTNIETKIGVMLSDIFNKWRTAYKVLARDIRNNRNNISYSMFEFTEMAEIYRTIIQVDQTDNYFNSIILFQREELNYTISYYYNYLMKLINKSYKYIIQKIPTNENDFNDILKERKKELKNYFDDIKEEIADSEFEYVSIENQLNILQTNEKDFFKVKYLLDKNKNETEETLEKAIEDIWSFEMFLEPGDQYSLVMRYYLENQEFGKSIEQYYEPVDKGEFLYLNLNKFKDILYDNWIFDTDDFVNLLNNALSETDKEIKNELFVKLEEYSTIIENEINKFFDDDIENIINSFYVDQIKDLISSQIENIQKKALELIDEVETSLKAEIERIKNNPGLFQLNMDIIILGIKNLENLIKYNINASIFEVLNTFNNNMHKNLYINCIQSKLANYLNQAKIITSSNEFKKYELLNSSYNIGEIIYNLTKDVINNYENIIIKKINNKYAEYYEKIKLSVNLTNIYTILETKLQNIIQSDLSPLITPANNCTSITCAKFNFSQETMNNINTITSQKTNNIRSEMSAIKGNNYLVNYACRLDFTNSGLNVIKPICESLKLFLSYEKEQQVSRINEYIKNAIKSNLEDFLNDVVPNFGNEFFERIIDYNINFKLVNLYENLHYSLSQTLLYYHALNIVTDVNDLPYDLKIRLYQLNDLDITVVNKVEEIKELSERKLTELIDELKHLAKNTYNQFIKNNSIIQKNFNPNILEKIDLNLEEIMPDIEKHYQTVLQTYLKEKFMKSFSDVLDEATKDTIKFFNEEKNHLMQELDNLFSSREDKDLNEVNRNINSTLESIRAYKNFFLTFKLTEGAKSFFLNYAKNTLIPILQQFNKDLYERMKEIIITEINEKSEGIELLSPEPFKNITNMLYTELIFGSILYVHNETYRYCETEEIYRNNLISARNKNNNNLERRRLVEESEEDSADEIKQRIESMDVEESLDLLKNKTRNTKKTIENLYAFYRIALKIHDYKFKLNIDAKAINTTIAQNRYSDEIQRFLKTKLSTLYNTLVYYYNEINYNVFLLQQDLIDSFTSIYDTMVLCIDITSNVLNDEYKKISDETERINKTRSNYIEEFLDTFNYVHPSENMMTKGFASFNSLSEYAEFKLDFDLEGNKFKYPKIKAKIFNKIIPEDVLIKVITGNGFCIQKGHEFNINFNDASYTLTVEYDTKSRYINITTYTKVDKYQYSLNIVNQTGDMETIELAVGPYVSTFKCVNINRKKETIKNIEEPAKYMNQSTIIFN